MYAKASPPLGPGRVLQATGNADGLGEERTLDAAWSDEPGGVGALPHALRMTHRAAPMSNAVTRQQSPDSRRVIRLQSQTWT